MMEEPRGRIFQDDKFIFSEFNGLRIEKLIVCEVPETHTIAMIYLKVENNSWYNFFLDVGFAVWGNCGYFEEDDSYNYFDKTDDFQVVNKVITKIYCEPIKNHCKVVIELENEDTLVLQALNPNDYDSNSEFIKLDNVKL